MFPFIEVRLVPVAAAAIAAMLFGVLWYSPFMFGSKWLHFSQQLSANPGVAFAREFVMTLIGAYFLSSLIVMTQVDTWEGTFFVTLIAWLAIGLPEELTHIIWERRPVQLFFVDAGHGLLTVLILAAVLHLWP